MGKYQYLKQRMHSRYSSSIGRLRVMESLPYKCIIEAIKLQFPLLSVVVVLKNQSLKSSTMLLASAPLKVGVVSLVKLSLFDVLSDSATKSELMEPPVQKYQ